MESGLRRLWARRKNKNNTPQHKASFDGSSTYSRPSISTADGRPSLALSSNPPDMIYSQEKVNNYRSYPSPNSTGHGYLHANQRVQPTLVGISRPADTSNRPGTTGGLRTDLRQASGSAGRRSAEQWRGQFSNISDAKRPMSPRYVDIFAVATSIPSYSSRYNEEVAERNLDFLRIAMEQEPKTYHPSSKYQEHVAVRNTTLPSTARTSVDQPRQSSEQWPSRGIVSRDERDISGAQHRKMYTNLASGLAIPSSRPSQDSSFYYAGMHVQDSGGSGDQTPKGLYKTTGDNGAELAGMNQHGITSQDKPQFYARVASDAYEGNAVTSNPVHGVYSRAYPKGTTDAISDYALSASELGRQSHSRQSATRSRNSERSDRRFPDSFLRSQNMSNWPHNKTINLQDRTIMDLTGEEDKISEVSEGSSIYGYAENSPVIEQAKMGSFQRIPPRPSSGLSKVMSENPMPSVPEFGVPNNFDMDQIRMTRSASRGKSTNLAVPHSYMAFSPISTLASSSPRSSTVELEEAPLSTVHGSTATFDTQDEHASTPMPNGEMRSADTKDAAYFDGSAADDTRSGESTPKAHMINAAHISGHALSMNSLASRVEVARENTATPQKDTQSSGAEQRTTPSIYDSPESLRSIDYVNPGDSFGVQTRDFAIPLKKSISSMKKAEPVSLQKSATENATRVAQRAQSKTPSKGSRSRTKQHSSASRKVSSSEFDEEAFARKQAEARAALIRLQQSLDEDFLTLPEPRGRVVIDSEVDGRPVAPMSAYFKSTKPVASTSNYLGAESENRSANIQNSSWEAERVPSMSSLRAKSESKAYKRSAPPSLKNFDAPTSPTSTQFSPTLLHIPQNSMKPPPSPGEISLSSFPLPTSRPNSEHEPVNGAGSRPMNLNHMRSNSTKSQMSTASQYSIPSYMIPDRSSSVRDTLTEEDEEYGFEI